MKTIKYSTAKRYSTEQLYKHLDRLMTSLDCDTYLIDYQYGKAYIWYAAERRYRLWSCMNEYDHSCAISAIMHVCSMHDIDNDFPYLGE